MHALELIRPAPPLREYVRFYAQRNARIEEGAALHPVTARAAPLLEFHFGDRIQVAYQEPKSVETSPRAVVVGMQTHYRGQLRLRGNVDCFVIMFQPTGLHRLFSIPMPELTDRSYEAHSVFGACISLLEHRLADCRTLSERVAVADEFLVQRSLGVCGSDGISAAANRILFGGGNARIAALANDAGLSTRQFERGFIQCVGMRPKLYARIARFEAALDSKARSSSNSWTDVAHQYGYFDQMHMVHDFEDFAGHTPTQTLTQIETLFRKQIEAARVSRSGTAGGDPRLIL